MSSVRLGELMATRVPSVNPAKFEDEDFELWSIPAFDQGAPEKLTGAEIGSSKKVIQPGDVLLSRIVPHIRRSWVVSENADGRRQIGSGEWMIFRSDRFDPDYLRHFLISDVFHPQLMQTVAGVGGSLLRARPEGVKDISLFLPPLDEQKRIAAILDQADELRRKRQRAIDRLGQLGQAIFHDMFGDIRLGKNEFQTLTLNEIADVRLGKMLDKGKSNGGTMRPYLRNANVRWFDFDLGNVSEMEFSDNELSRFSVKNGDLLICEGGEPGRCAVWRDDPREIYYQKALHRARVKSEIVLPDFLSHWFFNAAQSGLLADSVTSATIAHLTGVKIKKLEIIIPPMSRQLEFVRRLNELENYMRIQHSAATLTFSMFNAVQHRAFRGEL